MCNHLWIWSPWLIHSLSEIWSDFCFKIQFDIWSDIRLDLHVALIWLYITSYLQFNILELSIRPWVNIILFSGLLGWVIWCEISWFSVDKPFICNWPGQWPCWCSTRHNGILMQAFIAMQWARTSLIWSLATGQGVQLFPMVFHIKCILPFKRLWVICENFHDIVWCQGVRLFPTPCCNSPFLEIDVEEWWQELARYGRKLVTHPQPSQLTTVLLEGDIAITLYHSQQTIWCARMMMTDVNKDLPDMGTRCWQGTPTTLQASWP